MTGLKLSVFISSNVKLNIPNKHTIIFNLENQLHINYS